MAFKAKTDFFELADAALIIASSEDGNAAEHYEATGQHGEYVGDEVYGERLTSPSCEYKVKSQITKKSIVLGGITTIGNKKIMLGSVSISTSGGGEPSVSASGEEVEPNASQGCHYSIEINGLEPKHHAQILFSCATVSGTGCHLTAADYELTVTIGTTPVNGAIIASDCYEGKVTASLTIIQCGDAAPTVAAGQGWKITSPLTQTNPDAEFPTWTCELTMYPTFSEASAE